MCFLGRLQHSHVVAVPLVPAPQVGEQGEGAAGRDADGHLDAEGQELVLLQRVHPHLGEHRAQLGLVPTGIAHALGPREKGQGLVPSPSLWPAPSSLWPRASSAQRRCCSSDKPGAGAACQGQEGEQEEEQEAAAPTGDHPTLLLWSQGTESGTSVCLQETTYFLQQRKSFPYEGTQSTPRLSLHPSGEPPLPPSSLPPHIPLILLLTGPAEFFS